MTPITENLRRFVAEVVWSPPATSHRNWHRSRRLRAGWLPGFHRASPSTPLDASSYVAGTVAGWVAAARVATIVCVTTLEDPFSPRAEPAQAPLRTRGADARRGRHTPD